MNSLPVLRIEGRRRFAFGAQLDIAQKIATMTEANSPGQLVASMPEEDPSQDSIDILLSSELNNLSLERRSQLLDDVHGVSNEIDESPEFISESLGRLEQDLETIRNKKAYDYAYALDPQYVKKRKLRLQFLRATSFDTSSAASRIVKHFEVKMELFGKDKLAKDITQDDLSKEDIDCLFCGYNQILPVRDQAGRGVMCSLPHLKSNLDIKHKVRRLWNMKWCSLFVDRLISAILAATVLVLHRHGPYRK